jgi:hypothetical protein
MTGAQKSIPTQPKEKREFPYKMKRKRKEQEKTPLVVMTQPA